MSNCSLKFWRSILLYIGCLLLAWQSNAQTLTIKAVLGVVRDDSSRMPLAGATIMFGDGQQAVVAGPKGRFNLGDFSNRPLLLTISCLGYATQLLQVTPQAQHDTIRVFLHRQSLVLAETVVRGHLQPIEVDIDKLRVEVSRYKGNPTASADNLLKLIPGLSIDQQGQIAVRGDTNIQLLVDGKPALLTGRQLIDWLRSLPVSALRSVEVLSPGSARLDAENTGGALNIVLQKQQFDGYRGNVNLGAGTRFNHQTSAYLMLKKNRLTSTFNIGLYTHPNGGLQTAERVGVSPEGNNYKLTQAGTRTAHDYSINLGANGSWDVDTTLLVSSKVFIDLFQLNAQNDVAYRNATNGIVDENFTIRQNRQLSNSGVSASLSADKLYTKGRKLIADVLYSFRAESVTNSLYTDALLQGTDDLQTYKNEGALQIRWEQPLSKGGKMEIGTKEVARFNRADYPIVTTPGLLDRVWFSQYTAALYGLHNLTLGKLKLQYGLRGEYLLNSFTATQEGDYTKSYLNIFPSAAIFRALEKGSLRLSYARKTRRPGISYLNNFVDRRDPKNISVGNTTLNPEFKDIIDFTVTIGKNKFTSITNLYYRHTRDAIVSYVIPLANNTVTTTYTNAGTEVMVGISPNLALEVKNINLNSSLDFSYYKVTDQVLNFANAGFMLGVTANVSYKFNNQWFVDISDIYNARRILLNGNAMGWNTLGLTIQHTIKDRYLLTLNARDIFNTSRFITHYYTDSFAYTNNYRPQIQAFILSATYRFGKKFKYKEQKAGMQLDDGVERSNR